MFIDGIEIFIRQFLPALLLTIFIECSIIYLLYHELKFCYYVMLINLLTNPLLNFILIFYYYYFNANFYYLLLAILEIIIIFIEGVLIKKLCRFSIRKALLISLLINACSFFAGVIVFGV